MTLSFHKVMFSADEIIDLIQDSLEENHTLNIFLQEFIDIAEERSRK